MSVSSTLASGDVPHARTGFGQGLARADRWGDAALVGAVVFAALIALGDRLLGDPDTQWHVRVGADIWASRTLPWTDRYSHTFAGQPWIAKEWLSQLILAAAYRAAGWGGVVSLAALTFATTFALLFGWLAKRLRRSAALALTLLAVMFVAPHILARPHALALLPLLVWTTALIGAAERGEPPSAWLLALLVGWVNLHGSFTVAYPLAALIGSDAVLAAPPLRRRLLAGQWALFGIGMLAAGCLSPYGVAALAVQAGLFGSGEALPFLTEWQPLAFDATGLAAVATAAILLVALATEPRRNAVAAATVLVVFAMALRHTRFLDVFALVAPAVAASPLARSFPALAPGPERDEPAGTVRLAAAAAVGLLGLALTTLRSPEPAPGVTPAAALAAAERAGLMGPVYNDYDFGGFLIRRGVPTFVDGRTDQLFLSGFLSGLFRAVRDEADLSFVALLDRHGVTWALVRPDSPAAHHLARASGWQRIHTDEVATVYGRNPDGLLRTTLAP